MLCISPTTHCFLSFSCREKEESSSGGRRRSEGRKAEGGMYAPALPACLVGKGSMLKREKKWVGEKEGRRGRKNREKRRGVCGKSTHHTCAAIRLMVVWLASLSLLSYHGREQKEGMPAWEEEEGRKEGESLCFDLGKWKAYIYSMKEAGNPYTWAGRLC